MAIYYRVDLRNTTGELVGQTDYFTGLSYTIRWNGLGEYELQLSGWDDDIIALFPVDGLVELWRKDTEAGPDWFKVFVGIHKDFVEARDESGARVWISRGPSPEELLHKAFILWPAGSAQTGKSGITSTVILAYVNENIGPLALSGGRDINGVISGLALAADPAIGPSWEGSRTRENLLEILQELVTHAKSHGAYIDFRIVPGDGYTWLFEVGQFASDRTNVGLDTETGLNGAGNVPVVFGEEIGNIQSFTRSKIRSTEATVIVALGQGEEENRLTATATDAAADTASPIAHREGVLNASQETTTAGLTDAAQAELETRTAQETFDFVPLLGGSQLLWRDFYPGDRLTAMHRGDEFHKRVSEVSVQVAPSQGGPLEQISFVFEDV